MAGPGRDGTTACRSAGAVGVADCVVAGHKAGYIMARVPGHPRAGRGMYVFEHILVMEEMLGRYLLPGESVHHRNGVRDDNRPENPELWTRPQPTGIRASDAVAWARHILELLRRAGLHLQQCSGSPLSTLGGGGNRTLVLQYFTRASPGAACSAVSQPRRSLQASRRAGSAAVRCPVSSRGRARRWILLADARHRAGGFPGLTAPSSL